MKKFTQIIAIVISLCTFVTMSYSQTMNVHTNSGTTQFQLSEIEGDSLESKIDNYPTSKGSKLISGLASFSSATVSGNTTTSITVVPNVIFF